MSDNGEHNGHDIVVIGASAGGVEALIEFFQDLPPTLPAAIFVVMHTSPTSPGVLPAILDRAGALPVTFARQGERFAHGRVYVAPPDHHMLLLDNAISLTRGPRENGFRPAVDPLFRTAARRHDGRVIGVVLSGGLDDGTEGLTFIKARGGLAVVQDPAEAVFPSMPQCALDAVKVDHIATMKQMPDLLGRLTREPSRRGAVKMPQAIHDPGESAAQPDTALKNQSLPGPPTGLICPECGGALWEFKEGQLVRYRCHVGHNFTSRGLMATKGAELETAWWTALRALEENAELRRRMANRATEGRLAGIAEHYRKAAQEAEQRAASCDSFSCPTAKATASPRASRLPPRRSGGRPGHRRAPERPARNSHRWMALLESSFVGGQRARRMGFTSPPQLPWPRKNRHGSRRKEPLRPCGGGQSRNPGAPSCAPGPPALSGDPSPPSRPFRLPRRWWKSFPRVPRSRAS